jgi:hypothetical protein
MYPNPHRNRHAGEYVRGRVGSFAQVSGTPLLFFICLQQMKVAVCGTVNYVLALGHH